MRVASLRDGRDGRLVVVDSELRRAAPVPEGPVTLQAALDEWERWEDRLEQACEDLDRGRAPGAFELDHAALAAPLPRAYQWSEGSTFLAHMERCRGARGAALPEGHGRRLAAYQGGSDVFLGPRERVPLGEESWGLDVEPTVAVITDDVPAGTAAAECPAHVKLVLMANDWTLRELLHEEFAIGVGFYQCKPCRTFSPVAVSPSSLGDAWTGAMLRAAVSVRIDGREIGRPRADEDMAFDFSRIISHLARTRTLGAGSVIGSGTVSNRDPGHGIGCLAELRAEQSVAGEEVSEYLAPGGRVAIDALDAAGASLFGAMDQEIVRAALVTRAAASTS